MALAECLIASQEGLGSNSPRVAFILVALVAVVLVSVVYVFIRTARKNSSKPE